MKIFKPVESYKYDGVLTYSTHCFRLIAAQERYSVHQGKP